MKKYTTLALAVLSLAACNKENEFVPGTPQGKEITIIASRGEAETRTVVQENGTSVWWSAAEKIDVFAGPEAAAAVFTGQNDAPAASATFKGTADITFDGKTDVYAVYPSSSDNAVNADGTVTVSLPATQAAVAGTFADGVFPAIAVSKTASMTFRNAAGGIKFMVGEDNVSEVTFEAIGGESLAGVATFSLPDGIPALKGVASPSSKVTVTAPEGGFEKGKEYYATVLPVKLSAGITITLKRGESEPVTLSSGTERTVKRGAIANIGTLSGPKSLEIKTVWAMYSTAEGAWNEYYGGTAGTDRNIAMDDEFVYIAENSSTPKLWAISVSDHKAVSAVNVEGVSGGTHPLSCPRVIKNTDPAVNGGKDVLVCSSLTRGGENPKLYLWLDGINKPPKAVTLTTFATDSWYGDTFTVSGTLQDGILFFDKTDSGGNGIVTFNLKGVPGDKLFLLKRITFNSAFGSHNGICAYYPFPGNDNAGVYSPGRGFESRGLYASFGGDLKSEGNAAYTPTLTQLEYADGRNGFVLGYNFLEWQGKRYVVYGKQPDTATGYVYVLEGEATQDWLDIINFAPVKFRRDLAVTSGGRTSGNSGMDVTARIIDGELYFAAQKQNVACGLYKLVYE